MSVVQSATVGAAHRDRTLSGYEHPAVFSANPYLVIFNSSHLAGGSGRLLRIILASVTARSLAAESVTPDDSRPPE